MFFNAAEFATGFIERMNTIAKYVASTTLREATWNATVIGTAPSLNLADVSRFRSGVVALGYTPR